MKFIGFMLTVIAAGLAFIGWRLVSAGKMTADFQVAAESITASNQALIESNSRLENSTVSLRQELREVRESVIEKLRR